MNLILTRTDRNETGVFGELKETSGETVAFTLEHAYPNEIGGFAAKLPPGIYLCRRGMHRLHSMTEDFESFEVMGVAGHQGILFHVGNFNRDSEGCILLGAHRQGNAIAESKAAFKAFLDLQNGINEFNLTVKDEQ